jgi:hypothetical protein
MNPVDGLSREHSPEVGLRVSPDRGRSAGDEPRGENRGRRRAAGIYGAIITASVMAAAGGSLPTTALAVSVLITLVVYWLAEQYAEILGRQAAHGHLPTWDTVREDLATGWPIVSASFAPLAALALTRAAGASPSAAANTGVGVAIALLTLYGWSAGRAAQLSGWRLAGATSAAAVLGLVMVVLKNLVIVSLH